MKKIIKTLLLLILYYPLFDLMLFYSFVLRAAVKLGRIPIYNNPDPQELGFNTHFSLVFWSSEPIPYCIAIIMLYGVICLIKKKNVLQINKLHFIMFGLFLLLLLFTFLSPLFIWFVD